MYFFIWTVLELYLFSWCVDRWGFFDTLFLYMVPSVLGVFFLSVLSQRAMAAMHRMQNFNGRPEEMPMAGLHIALQYVGAIFLIIPSVVTRVVGAFVILPGLRHILLWLGKAWIFSRLAKNLSSRGGVFFRFGGRSWGSGNFRDPPDTDSFRDVTPEKLTSEQSKRHDIIDVESKKLN